MKERIKNIGMIAIAAIICLGCAHPYGSSLEDNWGQSYHMALQSQLAYHEKHQPVEPVAGFDGVNAATANSKYRESFKIAVPPPVYNINFGL